MANPNKKAANAVQHNAHVIAAQNAAIVAAFSAAPVYNAAPAPAPVAVAPATTPRGAATLRRWGACQKGIANATTLTGPAVKDLNLPANTVITCHVNHNPKQRSSAPVFALYFGPNPTVGATTTWGAFLQAMAKGGNGVAPSTLSVAAGHLAWDTNHGFISFAIPQA